ncbi:MAG: flagellar export protein FliJ [Candidatus Melainabacteria bacterium RIFOXYA12_FULL_32_12]|nr:MAG: flagellar export protein FliJ [Candidatus Melainabacteria bacterium GWF2_32_7]OGI18449.1 MAG: flagellar export protein FliJ [Candidatus Melainabacteria bacterium RIFOXYA2_FULL_32_9]OGI30992.1 MAG: flagellar export protein FliJ [Candidatus Melainabacteria bacterium RIFOXYA12_FULL_32_12]
MPFVYRLQKILNYRIQKKDEQIEVVKKAEQEVHRIQNEIDNNKQTVLELRQNMRMAAHVLMESYDVYIKHINDIIDQLEYQKTLAIQKLQEEREKLVELEKAVKVLEKHKEKAYEQYKDEENKAEMRRLDEVAGLKHFAKSQEIKQEELEELEKILEGKSDFNEF